MLKRAINEGDIIDEYFKWLSFKVDGLSRRDNEYSKLLSLLHDQEFYAVVELDENRLEEGLLQRDKFEDEIGYPTYGALERECSILEMLVALAEDFRELNNNKYPTSAYFWEMIENLGLIHCTDAEWNVTMEHYIFEVLARFLSRDYRPNGMGGLFPLNNPPEDQTDVEIWYQLAAYYNENYYDSDSEV